MVFKKSNLNTDNGNYDEDRAVDYNGMSESVVRIARSNWIDPIHCLTSILYSALVFKSFSIRKKTKTADSLKFFWYLCIDTGNSKIYQWKRIIRIFHHSLVVGSCSLDQVWVYLDEVSFPVLYPRRSSHCSHAGENVEHPVYGRFQQKTDTNQN